LVYDSRLTFFVVSMDGVGLYRVASSCPKSFGACQCISTNDHRPFSGFGKFYSAIVQQPLTIPLATTPKRRLSLESPCNGKPTQ